MATAIGHEPHESPLVMLVPLGVLAAGALLAGLVFARLHRRRDAEHSGRARSSRSDNDVLEEMHARSFVAWAPTDRDGDRLRVAWLFYIGAASAASNWPTASPVLYRFLLNKWYFDELYDIIFVRPAKWLGRLLWKSGDGMIIDGLGPDGMSARVVDITRGVVRLQTGYVYHYAFAMLIGVAALHHLVHARGSPLMFGFGTSPG